MDYMPNPGSSNQNAPSAWPLPSMWTFLDVHRYICDIGYSKYANCFSRNAINGARLGDLSVYDLQRFGVKSIADAIRLHAIITKTCNIKLYNFEGMDEPPNVSYRGAGNSNILPVLPVCHDKLKLPTIPGRHCIMNPRDMCLPYRDAGDRCYRYNLPVQSYHDHCMVIGRTDVWQLYNSLF
ncbi:unnamed protein product [Lymnaea stagnalis]|uniref:SAM domain-containing protein n=1 Tax=Lymnaea stagnalis TaxID=6523 RepID=A0AAV2HM80_LYMST